MREFRKTTGRNKRGQVWHIGIDPKDPETYMVKWGLMDGALQTKTDRPGPCGTEGYSDYQTPADYAIFCMNRDIRKKEEEGYVEYIDGKPARTVATSVSFSKGLPKNLCFYKPKTEIDNDKLKKLEDLGRAIWTLKRDGMMHIILKRDGVCEVYSRRMDLVTEKYPHILESVKRLRLPDNTIMVGEIVLLKEDGTDDFKGVSRICRSLEELSLAYQGLGNFPNAKHGEEVLGKVAYYVFDIPFYDGKDLLKDTPVRERLSLMREVFSRLDPNLSVNTGLRATKRQLMAESKRRETMLRRHHIAPLKIFHTSAADDVELAKEMGIEGFVVMDADACYGDRGYSFDGKAKRPEGIYKRKPKFEDEFIITGVYEGTGRNRDRFGGFTMSQIHPTTGNRIDCGKCGGGFTDEHRDEFLDEGLIGKTIKVEFDSRQPVKNGVYALRFPVYKGYSDKSPEECIAQNIEEE